MDMVVGMSTCTYLIGIAVGVTDLRPFTYAPCAPNVIPNVEITDIPQSKVNGGCV